MRLNELYSIYKDDVQFFDIYIREAHPDDGWRAGANLKEKIYYDEPTTDDERTEVAAVCQTAMDIQMPMLIDSIDNDVEKKYISMPMRLFLIDADGKIAYAGAEGPFGFKADELEDAIKEMVG